MPTWTQSRDVIELTTDEDKLLTADFTNIIYGDDLASVVRVEETTDIGLVLGTGTINTSGTVSVDGQTIAQDSCVQFMCDCTAADAGEGVIRVVVRTDDGNQHSLDCRVRVYA